MYQEIEVEKLLKIKTTGRDDSNSTFINFPYEPTPYPVLGELANTGYITKKDKIIDYGCGKGRVDFFLAYFTKAKMIGIEYDSRLFNRAESNFNTSVSSNRVELINSCASKYNIPDDVTGAYFFNPFSIDMFKEVLENIRKSLKKSNREFKLFFYYPSKEYLDFLNETIDIEFVEDIDCRDHFKNYNHREYIAYFRINTPE